MPAGELANVDIATTTPIPSSQGFFFFSIIICQSDPVTYQYHQSSLLVFLRYPLL